MKASPSKEVDPFEDQGEKEMRELPFMKTYSCVTAGAMKPVVYSC